MKNPILAKPTKSVYKGVLGSHSSQPWDYHNELNKERILSLISILLLPIAIGLYGAGISGKELFINQGDSLNILHGNMGYQDICFIGVDSQGNVQPEECSHISATCQISYSTTAQDFQIANYDTYDSSLGNCTEFNAYRATNVMAIIFAGMALIAMIIAHLRLLPSRTNTKVKIFALVVSFLSGACGIVAQCVVIDWWNYQMQNLVTLGFSPPGPNNVGTSTPTYNVLGQSLFYEVGAWVCALCSWLIYIVHFPSALGK